MIGLRERAWSPYVAGLVIALLQIPTFLLMDTALGASSSFVKVAGHIAALFDSGVGEAGYFAKYMSSGKYVWQLALVVGILLGAYVSMTFSGAKRKILSPVWDRTMGLKSLPQRAPVAFLGGFLMLFGARIAGGCTSGHGVSGLSQLAVGSTLAVAAMFAGGIAVAMLLRRA